MRISHAFAIALALLTGAVAASCRDDETEDDPGTTATGTTTTTTSDAGSGGTGGTTTTGGSGGTTTTGGSGGMGGSAGSGGEPPNGCSAGADHLRISEIVVTPVEGEYIEIWNVGTSPVDLSDYYLSDNAVYYEIATGPWAPDATPETDFVAGFPPGTMLPNGEAIVIQAGSDFFTEWGECPDFVLSETPIACGGGQIPAMVKPANGTIGANLGSLLSDNREMIMLFCWDGVSSTVRDVDYVTWGADFTDSSRVDKTGVAGYEADTARGSQLHAPDYDPANFESIARCDPAGAETAEATSGGNGIAGHDETSEDMGAAFTTEVLATPGVPSCVD